MRIPLYWVVVLGVAGALVNHSWSGAGNNDRQDVSSAFLQPFLGYTTKNHTTFTLNRETSYDWEIDQWTVPINLMATQLVKIGKMPAQFQLGATYYAEGPSGAPAWGIRFAVFLLFPK